MGDDVTILVTAYNQEAYIEEAIESALQQTLPCRVIVVDDGSADRSVALAKELGVQVVSLPHRGAVETFRAAAELVRTEHFLILAGDDCLHEAYVELTLDRMVDPGVGFVYTGAHYFGAFEGRLPAGGFSVARLLWGNYAHGTSLTRKRAYDAVGGFDSKFAIGLEDWALWVAMVDNGWWGSFVDLPLLHYRQHTLPSRNPRAWRIGAALRMKLVKKHPRLYLRHFPGVAAYAATRAFGRLGLRGTVRYR